LRAAVTVPSDWPPATAVHASPTSVVLEELPSLCSHGSDGNDVGTGVGSVVGLRLGSNVGMLVGSRAKDPALSRAKHIQMRRRSLGRR